MTNLERASFLEKFEMLCYSLLHCWMSSGCPSKEFRCSWRALIVNLWRLIFCWFSMKIVQIQVEYAGVNWYGCASRICHWIQRLLLLCRLRGRLPIITDPTVPLVMYRLELRFQVTWHAYCTEMESEHGARQCHRVRNRITVPFSIWKQYVAFHCQELQFDFLKNNVTQ